MLKSNTYKKIISIVFLIVLLTACGIDNDDPPAAVIRAQSFLAEQLDVPLEEIAIERIEEVEWTDSCFGLGGAAEICAAEKNPGWRVNFDVNGKPYEARSNMDGTIIRISP